MSLTITTIVCAYNERRLLPAGLHSLVEHFAERWAPIGREIRRTVFTFPLSGARRGA
jgi:hypothetical protein